MVPLLQNPRRVFEVLALIHVIGLAIVLSPLSFPYSGFEGASPTPQRVYIFETQRQFFNNKEELYHSDSGLWFVNQDRNSPSALLSEVPALAESRIVSYNCLKNLSCSLPAYTPRYILMSPGSLWLPTKEFPSVKQSTTLSLKRKSKSPGNLDSYQLDFQVRGPSHLSVVLCPSSNVSLTKWSLAADLLPTGFLNERPYYFIYVGRGYEKVTEPWTFSIDLKVPSNHSADLIDVVANGHYFTDVEYGPNLTAILNNKPTWSHATVWASWFIHKTFNHESNV